LISNGRAIPLLPDEKLRPSQASPCSRWSGPVYAELLAHPKATERFVDEFLTTTGVVMDCLLDEKIWREAGRRFAAYVGRRRRLGGGSPKRLLVDFLIGAHASLCADRLMTLDRDRYAQDFPRLRLI
jgi:predicted nucleic acid-binding protein